MDPKKKHLDKKGHEDFMKPAMWKHMKAAAKGAGWDLEWLFVEMERRSEGGIAPRIALAVALYSYLRMDRPERTAACYEYLEWSDGRRKHGRNSLSRPIEDVSVGGAKPYRVLRSPELLRDDQGERVAAAIDHDQLVIWIDPTVSDDRLPHVREEAASQARSDNAKSAGEE